MFSPTVSEIFVNVSVSLICSFIISLIYKYTYKGPGYSVSFVNSIIFLSAITAIVIMVIGNNLARAFGLVGALSIIRFRTAIKDTVDIVYIFLALAIGMAGGVGYHKLAIVGTIMIGSILILFSGRMSRLTQSREYILQFSFLAENSTWNDLISVTLSEFCRRFEPVSLRTFDKGRPVEYSYYVRLKKHRSSNQLVSRLREIEGISNISLFYDQQNI